MNGQWSWVSYDESVGKRVKYLEGVDQESFEVLSNENYGKDHNRVYYQGRLVKMADPHSFEVLNDRGYARDKDRVFLDCEKIFRADPVSFKVMEFPYAKDKDHVFCGTIPMILDKTDVENFKVTNTDKLMAASKSTIRSSYFIEFNPAYKWIEAEGSSHVVIGDWGTGEAGTKKFKGIRELK